MLRAAPVLVLVENGEKPIEKKTPMFKNKKISDEKSRLSRSSKFNSPMISSCDRTLTNCYCYFYY